MSASPVLGLLDRGGCCGIPCGDYSPFFSFLNLGRFHLVASRILCFRIWSSAAQLHLLLCYDG